MLPKLRTFYQQQKIHKMETSTQKDIKKASRHLAILIYDFLLDEAYDRPKSIKEHLDRASDCLEKVYKIGFTDYIMFKTLHPLIEVFSIGYRPIKVKDRLRAEQHKKKGNDFMSDNRFFKSAEFEYSMAILLNPRNAMYWCNRAASRIGLESYLSAISDCEKALELDRSYTKALAWQGIAHALTDHPGRAIRCYRKALRIEPGNEVCIANMDIINRKFNRTTFRVLEPLSRCGRHLARMVGNIANNHVLSKRLKPHSGNQEQRKKRFHLQHFRHGSLD